MLVRRGYFLHGRKQQHLLCYTWDQRGVREQELAAYIQKREDGSGCMDLLLWRRYGTPYHYSKGWDNDSKAIYRGVKKAFYSILSANEMQIRAISCNARG